MKTFLPYLIKKANVAFSLLFFLLVAQGIKAQSVGDYRTVAAGTDWSSLTSWERWSGSAWVTPTTGEGYPGQNSGTGNVIIRYGGSKTLDVSPANAIGSLNVGDGTVAGSGISNAAAILTIGAFTLEVSGNVVISKADLVRTGTLNNGSGTVKVGGSLSLAGAGVYTAGTGTLEYNASGNQNIFGATYYNLVTSGSGTKTIQANTVVSHDLTIGTGTTLDQAAFRTTLGNASVLTVNGTLDFTAQAGFIRTGSNVNATLTIGSSGWIKTADNLGLGPETNASLQQNVGTEIWTMTSIDANGTVEYYGSAAGQKVTDRNYNNLLITGTSQTKTWSTLATRTIGGTVIINGNFALSGAQTIYVGGNWTYNTGSFNSGMGTIDLNGSSQQTLGGSLAATFNNLTISNASGAILGIDQTVNGTLSLTGGSFDISNKILTIGDTAPAISGSFSSSRMIIADGGGVVRKRAYSNVNASYYFPIGDGASSNNGAEYTPVALSITGSAYSNAYIDVSLSDVNHSNNGSTANYLTRYWKITQSGITSCTATVTGTFINSSSDVVGTSGSIKAAQLNGVFSQTSNPWVKTGGSVLSGTTLTYAGATITAGQTSVFTGITGADPTVSITGGGVGSCDSNVSFNLGTSVTGDPNILYSWSPATFLSSTTIANPIVTSPTTTTTYTVTIRDGNGIAVTSSPSTITISSTTTWNSGAWFPCEPNATTDAVIMANFTSAGTSIVAKTLTVNHSAIVAISSGDSVTLDGALIVSSGSVTFDNNANLIQSGTTNTNSGAVIFKRNSSALKRLDYTLWSSPVAQLKLKAFSPETIRDRFHTYNTNTNVYDVVASPWLVGMLATKGYLIRMPNTHPTTPTIWTGEFKGVPNNGNYSFTMTVGVAGKRFNLVGNPYPSPISAINFANANSSNITGTLYFFRKTNGASGSSYCTWTAGGGFVSNGGAEAFNLNNVIQTGQGFLVEAKGTGTTLNFTNSMRVDNHANQFFKTADTTERNRIWLNASNSTGSFSQTMVGYIANATQDVDAGIDGRYINNDDIDLTSLIGSIPYAIQGRALPFDDSDVVPLSFKATTAGEYKITIDHVDGLFTDNQNIYLKDNLAGITYDLKSGSYSFVSDAGTFPSRFEVVYKKSQFGVNTNLFNANQVIVYKNYANDIVINTGSIIMDSVKVFDIRGRLLEEKETINNTQMTISSGLVGEVLLVKVTSEKGEVVTKKVIR